MDVYDGHYSVIVYGYMVHTDMYSSGKCLHFAIQNDHRNREFSQQNGDFP